MKSLTCLNKRAKEWMEDFQGAQALLNIQPRTEWRDMETTTIRGIQNQF